MSAKTKSPPNAALPFLTSAYEKLKPSAIRRVALWSAGMGTREFLEQMPPEFKSKEFLVVDSNPALSGQMVQGAKVHHPSSLDFAKIDCVVISSAVFHQEIKEQLQQMGTYAGPVIDLYEERIQSYGLVKWANDNNRFIEKNGLSPFLFTGEDTFLVAPNGVHLALAADDAHNQLIYHMIHRMYYERAETEIIIRLLPPNGCFVDVGANVGWFSLSVAKSLPGVSVHGFEPDPATHALLLKNISHNNVEGRVRPNLLALGERAEKLRFTKGLDTGNHLAGSAAPSGVQMIEVDCVALDDYAKENGLVIDFIKCDVEGAEMMVLRGAQKILAERKPTLLLEVVGSWMRRFGHTPDELFAFLAERGYSAYAISSDGQLQPLTSPDPSAGRNILFVHQSRPLPSKA